MKPAMLVWAVIISFGCAGSNDLRQQEQTLTYLKKDTVEVLQGTFFPLPFEDPDGVNDIHFVRGQHDFYCAFTRKNAKDKKTVYVSYSPDLKRWAPPRIVTDDIPSGMHMVAFGANRRARTLYLSLADPATFSTDGNSYSGNYWLGWEPMPSAKHREILEGNWQRRQKDKQDPALASHYEVEVDSLRRIFIFDWLSNRRYFTGLSAISDLQFLIVDEEADIYLAYKNQQSLSLPYFEQGAGLLRFDLDKLNIDSDGDGLSDIQELYFGLAPDNPDTDQDGIRDAEDRSPLSGGVRAITRDDSIRQATLEFIVPAEQLQNPHVVLSVNISDNTLQTFLNHRCKILCNTTLPTDNIQMNSPSYLSSSQAQVEIGYRGPLSSSHGFTVSLSRENGQWVAHGVDRVWHE